MIFTFPLTKNINKETTRNRMTLYIKYDINAACKKILQEQLNKLELNYSLISFGEVEIREAVSDEKLKQLYAGLKNYSIEIVESQKSIMVQKIKDLIMEMIYVEEKLPALKISSYLSGKLNKSYYYLNNLFSEVTYISIEKFIILQKIELAKQLMTTDELTISQIAWRLHFSSTAHLSGQFKNVTGLTPTAFQRIINERRNLNKKKQ